MSVPLFLALHEVVEIHRDQIARYGGTLGIRDMGLLQSALAMPSAGVGDEFLHADLFEMGAAYLFHLVKNHAFLDGNKRVGLASALVFLDLNGAPVSAGEDAIVDLVLDVATGKAGKAEVSIFLRRHAEAVPLAR